MSIAWTCVAHPADHGAFWRKGLDLLEEHDPKTFRAHISAKVYRRVCPKCAVTHQPGHMRPATESEVLGLIAARAA